MRSIRLLPAPLLAGAALCGLSRRRLIQAASLAALAGCGGGDAAGTPILNTRPGADAGEFVFTPGGPDFSEGGMGYTVGGVGCMLVLPGPTQPGRNRMRLRYRVRFEGFFTGNGEPAHWITMLRANLDGIKTGYYLGHGHIAGHINTPSSPAPWAAGMLESWSPDDGGKGGNRLFPEAESPELVDGVEYDCEVTSEPGAASALLSFSIALPGKRPFWVRTVADENRHLDMLSGNLVLACHFAPRAGVPGCVRVRGASLAFEPIAEKDPS